VTGDHGGVPDDYVTRAEFNMLRDRVMENSRRQDVLASADVSSAGTSAAISVQMTEVLKDVAEVRSEVRQFRDVHESLHAREAAQRVTGRRWAWGLAAVGVGSLWAPLVYLVAHIH